MYNSQCDTPEYCMLIHRHVGLYTHPISASKSEIHAHQYILCPSVQEYTQW